MCFSACHPGVDAERGGFSLFRPQVKCPGLCWSSTLCVIASHYNVCPCFKFNLKCPNNVMREETVTSDTMRFKGAIISSGNTQATVK